MTATISKHQMSRVTSAIALEGPLWGRRDNWRRQDPQQSVLKRFLVQVFTIFTVCSFVISVLGCATTYDKKGKFHRVRRGETIWTIARAYRHDPQTIAEYNNLEDPSDMKIGMKLYIPGREKKPGFKRLSGGGRVLKKEKKEDRSIEAHHGTFEWPISGPILSGFGYRNGRRHDGIDIKARVGTKVKAAGDGHVVFSGKMRGYGNLILIRHEDNFFTAYAHNDKNVAKKGEKVTKGGVIATVGRTGRTTGPHLHFEVRHGQQARNPLFFLPKQGS